MIVNASSIVHAVQIKHGIIKCQCECKKVYVQTKIMVGILANVFVKMANI